MIKNKKKLFRSGSSNSFRLSRKKSDKNNEIITIQRSQSERIPSHHPATITDSDGDDASQTTTPFSILTKKKSRSYSPSDYYFHTTSHGGINANLIPLSEQYATNETLLSLFSTLYEQENQYSVAYAAGMKFVEVALIQIPQNGYYKSKKYQKERVTSAATREGARPAW